MTVKTCEITVKNSIVNDKINNRKRH